MADADKGVAPEPLTGFEGYSLDVLRRIKENLDRGIDKVGEFWLQDQRDGKGPDEGTLNQRPKPGAATPREAGAAIQALLDSIEKTIKQKEELERG